MNTKTIIAIAAVLVVFGAGYAIAEPISNSNFWNAMMGNSGMGNMMGNSGMGNMMGNSGMGNMMGNSGMGNMMGNSGMGNMTEHYEYMKQNYPEMTKSCETMMGQQNYAP